MSLNDKLNQVIQYIPGATYKNCAGAFRIFAFVILCILLYGLILKMVFGLDFSSKDFMNYNVIHVPYYGEMSFWPITHFVLFMILGILFPCCDVIVIVAGIVWEIIEELFGKYYEKNIAKIDTSNKDIQYPVWWGGRVSDIVCNILGFYTGKLIAHIFNIKVVIPYINDSKVIPSKET